MDSHSKITQRHPQTGAQPSEQTAENAKKGQQQGHVGGIDEHLYKLVENNVAYAGEQFGENLRFNSEVLTNVLYDNIRKLLGDKFEADDFANWLADELLKNGYVLKSTAPSEGEKQSDSEPTEEIVYTIDEKDYQELLSKIHSTLVLLQLNKPTITKMFSDVGGQVKQLGNSVDTQSEMMVRRNKEIQDLVDRIQTNQENIQTYIENHEQVKREFAEKVLGLNKKVDEFSARQQQRQAQDGKLALKTKDILSRVGKNWQMQQDQTNKLYGQMQELGKKQPLSPKATMVEERYQTESKGGEMASIGKASPYVRKNTQPGRTPPTRIPPSGKPSARRSSGRLGESMFPGSPRSGKKPSRDVFGSPKKPSIAQRIKTKIGSGAAKLKNKISNSFIGKGYRAVVKAVKSVVKTVKVVVKAVAKTIAATWIATKFVAKTFYKAAKLTGKAVRATGRAVVKGVKKVASLVKKDGLKMAVMMFAPGKLVAKFGWKAVKFVGKNIWKGIKKLAFSAVALFAGLFGLMGKFVNKVGHWVGILARGIKDVACRFIVKPLANMMVSIFNFVSAVVLSPIHFIKWLIPAVLDRIFSALSSIKQVVKKVLKSTISIFKRVLCNPITIALLVGGLFFFLWKWLGPKLSGGIEGIKNTIVPALKSFAMTALGFLQTTWNILVSVSKFIFKWINKLTHPDGFIAKAVVWVVKTFLAIKRTIKSLMKATGRNSVDVLCMFLSGDMIGIAIHAAFGMIAKVWEFLKKTKVMTIIMGLIKFVLAIGKLIFSWATVIYRCIFGALWQLIRGNFGGVINAITKPWKDLWQQIKDVFTGKAFREEQSVETLTSNPVESNSEQAKNTNISVRNLKMKGTGRTEENLAHFNALQSSMGQAQYGDLLPRIQRMNDLYQENSKQVESYDEFLTKTWEVGQAGDDVAQQLLRQMLESPEISQKLLSVFFFYNPQTGQTQMLLPISYISQFLDNIRAMMSDPERNDSKAFKTIIEAFDQLNKERSHIVNNQGEVIADLADKLTKYNKETDKEGAKENELKDIIQTFNKGDLFSDATAKSSFQQMAGGRSKTRNVESVTGSDLGNNSLLKFEPLAVTKEGKVAVEDKEFVMPKKATEPPSRDTIGNVVLPPGSNPEPVKDEVDDKSIGDLWREHQRKRNEYLGQGHNDEQAHAVGLDDMTLDEFKQRYKKMNPKSPEQLEKEEENRNRRAAALRNAKMITAFHNQGKVANKEGFKFTGTPSIIQIETDNLRQTLYMFSPEWMKYYNATVLDENQIMLAINKDDKAAQERIRKMKEAEEKKKAEEAAQRKREQQILDYSAKVEGGVIEVKIGEDLQAMEDAYKIHMKKRMEFLGAGHNDEEAEKAGLRDFTWEDWKRHYRKMHGMPEDGIKRIPFEGKRKPRQINWEARYPMSVDELAQYGIEVSEDGPVMIPLDKAMKAAGSLLTNAKTIYAVRDGLEVMRQGLKTETNRLKDQRKEGQPVAVVQSGGGEAGEATQPEPPDQSQYSQVG